MNAGGMKLAAFTQDNWNSGGISGLEITKLMQIDNMKKGNS